MMERLLRESYGDIIIRWVSLNPVNHLSQALERCIGSAVKKGSESAFFLKRRPYRTHSRAGKIFCRRNGRKWLLHPGTVINGPAFLFYIPYIVWVAPTLSLSNAAIIVQKWKAKKLTITVTILQQNRTDWGFPPWHILCTFEALPATLMSVNSF